MTKGDDVKHGTEQLRKELDDDLRSPFLNICQEVEDKEKILRSDSSYYEIEK